MRWLGRGRTLYKLSIGGHSALDSKDHVCESGFSVRKAFARGYDYLPRSSLPKVPPGGGGSFRGPSHQTYQVAGESSREEPSWWGGGEIPWPTLTPVWIRERTAWLGRTARGSSRGLGHGDAVREAWVLKGKMRSRHNVGKRRGGCGARSRLVWLPPYVGQGVRARVPENSGGTTRDKQGCLALQRVPSSRLECGSGKKKPAVQGAGFLDGQDRA